MASKKRAPAKPARKKSTRRKLSTTDTSPVSRYARAVKAKRIVAGRLVRLACERHLKDLDWQKKLGLEWKPSRAAEVIEFFRTMLRLEDGSPFKLLPYQQFIVGALFGWYTVDGTRRFRTAYIETGKGSGKTPMAAGVGLYGLIADGESAPEVYSAAVTREQARIAFKDAYRMVEAHEELSDHVTRQVGSLTIPAKSATFRPVSSEHRGLDGLRPHIGLVDELHEHPTGIVVDKIRAGTKRRQNALLFEITNSGWDRTSVCWHHHEYSTKVLEGTMGNESWFAYVCTLDEGDDWHDEKVWAKANPGMIAGLPPAKYLREQVAEAVGMTAKENIVRRLSFCQWTEQEERWLDMDVWDRCGAEQINPDELEGEACIAGLDMASSRDLSAYVMVFGPDDEGRVRVLPRFWLPEETLAAKDSGRAEQDRLMLRQWADEGHIILTPGDVTDYDLVEEQILKDAERFPAQEIAVDRWGITQLVTHLQDRLGEKVILFAQSMASMSAPSKEMEKLAAEGKLLHGNNPVLRWMASNVAIRYGPDGQIKPDRLRSREKIDGIIALIMALGRVIARPDEGESIYEARHAAGEEIMDAW